VLSEYELNEAEVRLLTEAARTVDELERLRDALVDAEPLVAGSTGQPKPNGLFEEVRRHRETLQRLCAAMAIPKVGEEEGEPGSSAKARRAAQVRWLGTDRRGAS